MKKLCLVVLALLCLLGASAVHAAWNADWPKRVKLALDTSGSGVALAAGVDSVPVLVRLHTGNFPFGDARSDGSDLRFIAADDKTPLKFHIEKFDGLNELALVWVQVPKLAPGTQAETVWLYYGNANAVPAGDAKGSYDNAQALVMHFSDSAATPQDSTANANHATRSTARASAAGLIGGSLVFDGSVEMQIAERPSMNAATNGSTVSFWIKPEGLADSLLFVQGEGARALRVGLRGGRLFAQAGAVTATAPSAATAGAWLHVAVVVKDGVQLYVAGQEMARASGAAPPSSGNVAVGRAYRGELDELQLATTARSPDWIRLAAQSQGQDARLLSFAPADAEGGGEASYITILLSAVTIDGWIVIAILAVMFVVSIYVMISKTVFVQAALRDNDLFKARFAGLMDKLRADSTGPSATFDGVAAGAAGGPALRNSSLRRLYEAGEHELRARFKVYAEQGRSPVLSGQSIEAIRATVDARLVREIQLLNSSMVLLTISIAGGPFLGLLGTVVGVMITFAAIAAAGDVNVNAIAPGIAAALVATVAGLAVAIPALFGYNYLASKISELNSDMQVFIDEFITRVAENHSV